MKKLIVSIATTLLCFSGALAQEVTLQPPIQDTFITGGIPDQNRGTDNTMIVQWDNGVRRSLIQFDQQEIEDAVNNNGNILERAVLVLYADVNEYWGAIENRLSKKWFH